MVALLCSLAGCDDQPPPAPAVAPAPPPAPSIVATESLEQQLATRAGVVAKGFLPASPVATGPLVTGASRDHTFVLAGGACHKFVSVSSSKVRELDLLLYDQNGVLVQRDISDDNSPGVGLDSPICPQAPAAYRLQVKMVAGEGEYAVQMFQSKP